MFRPKFYFQLENFFGHKFFSYHSYFNLEFYTSNKRKKIPQSGICPAPCGLCQCARCFRLSFYQRLSSVKGRLLSRVVLCQSLSSVKGLLPSKVVLHQKSSSVKGRLPSSAPELPPKWINQNELGCLDKESLEDKRPEIRTNTHTENDM